MLVKKDLDSMIDGTRFETVALIKSYEVRPTKKGTKYIDGMLEIKGSVAFKVWSGGTFDELDKYDYCGSICKISGVVNEFNGTKSVILDSVIALQEGVYNESDFFEDRYDIESYWNAFNKVIKNSCSEKGVLIFNKVIGIVEERFKVEFAARSHHDAYKGGLLAHTYKETLLMSKVVKLYKSIVEKLNTDLLILGCALHDIGKTMEYTNGSIIGNGLIVSHHTFGVEILHSCKEYIVGVYDEEFYYRLLAIVEQHHGEFEETPRTIEAYLVHLVDNLESKFQSINESLEGDTGVVCIDTFKLH